MLVNYLKLSLFFAAILFFVSCEKETTCIEPLTECEQNCQMIPEMGWCGTGEPHYYYYDPSEGRCMLYVYIGGDIPFETLQECESCRCNKNPMDN